jgi:hypothetical protein
LAKARFVSRYGNYSVGVQDKIVNNFGDGKSQVVKPRIDANFHNRFVTDNDFAVALSSFSFPGLPFDEETNSDISPRYRVSVWDSEWAKENEGLSEEEADLCISKLRFTIGTDHAEVTQPPASVPFPSYDTLSIEEILQIVKLTSIDPVSVVEYEKENQNRQGVIDGLEGRTADDDAIVVQA